MISFAVKSLLSFFLLVGIWNPAGAGLVASATGKPAPSLGCSRDFSICEIGSFRFPLAEKDSVIGAIADRARQGLLIGHIHEFFAGLASKAPGEGGKL